MTEEVFEIKVDAQTVAESLAAVSDNDKGFKSEKAEEIQKRLVELAAEIDPNLDPAALSIGVARDLQEAYVAAVKAGRYSEEEAETFRKATPPPTAKVTEGSPDEQ